MTGMFFVVKLSFVNASKISFAAASVHARGISNIQHPLLQHKKPQPPLRRLWF